MGVLANIFTWWNGATYGTRIFSRRNGAEVGSDALGNLYFETRVSRKGPHRRWVIYAGSNDASRVPAEWHGWLHNTIEDPPARDATPVRAWQKPALPNLTGTVEAYRPAGALESGGRRAAATGDYEAWSPN